MAEPLSMPLTQAQSLSGHELLLPQAITGRRAVIVIGFSQGSQKSMERWDKEIGADVTGRAGIPIYNVAVLQDAPRFLRALITHSMKLLIPTAGHDRFLTVTQGQAELKKAVDFSDRDSAYILVLDPAGKIVYQTHSDPTESAKRQLINQLNEN